MPNASTATATTAGKPTIPLSDRLSYSPGEYAALHGIGRTTLYDAWKRGGGPDYFMVGNRRRIPRDAEWRPIGAHDNADRPSGQSAA